MTGDRLQIRTERHGQAPGHDRRPASARPPAFRPGDADLRKADKPGSVRHMRVPTKSAATLRRVGARYLRRRPSLIVIPPAGVGFPGGRAREGGRRFLHRGHRQPGLGSAPGHRDPPARHPVLSGAGPHWPVRRGGKRGRIRITQRRRAGRSRDSGPDGIVRSDQGHEHGGAAQCCRTGARWRRRTDGSSQRDPASPGHQADHAPELGRPARDRVRRRRPARASGGLIIRAQPACRRPTAAFSIVGSSSSTALAAGPSGMKLSSLVTRVIRPA
jgi:hypothetical protein